MNVMVLLREKLKYWKLVAVIAILGTIISACGGNNQPTPDVVATKTPAEVSTATASPTNAPAASTPTASPTSIKPTNSPVPSPAVQTTPTVTLSPTAPVKPETGSKIAEDGDAIAVHYTGTLDNGDVFDTSKDGDPPLEFVLGSGQMIPGFDKAVKGMAVGEIKTVRLLPNEAYGEIDDDLILEMPLEGAPDGLKVGDSVRLTNGMPVTIVEITDESVMIDANHRLAGQALTFEIEIMSID